MTAVTHLLITKYLLKLRAICRFCNVNIWMENGSRSESQLCLVNQLKQNDLITLRLDLSGKASVRKRRVTALEHEQWNNLER